MTACINTNMKKVKTLYAVPCAFTSGGEYTEDDIFFTTFHTKDEEEALKLASCVTGQDRALDSLVLINEYGEIFSL